MNEDNQKCKTQWTIMFYFAADNDLEEAAFKVLKQIKKAGSSKDLNLIAQLDTRGIGRTFRFRLRDENTTLEEDLLDIAGEINTGDPKELKKFIEWVRHEFPAEYFMLIIWGHGQGWQMANDTHTPNRAAALTTDRLVFTNNHISASVANGSELRVFSQNADGNKRLGGLLDMFSSLSLKPSARSWFDSLREIFGDDYKDRKKKEDALTCIGLSEALKGALQNVKLDILGMDACMMGMAEVGYQIRRNVHYLVASEDAVPVDGWPYDTILACLRREPYMSPDALALTIVRKYLLRYGEEPKGATISSCDLNFSKKLNEAVKALVETLTPKMSDPKVHLATMIARADAQSFYLRDFVDLFDYCERLNQISVHIDIKDACKNVMNAIHEDVNEVLSEGTFVRAYGFVSSPMKGARGASIYLPCHNMEGYGYQGPYESEEIEIYKELPFVKETGWYGFLKKFTSPVRPAGCGAGTDAEISQETSVGYEGHSGLGCFNGFDHIKSECGTPLKMPLPHYMAIPGNISNDPCNEQDQE